jgi:NADH-ubiquinone oxidoreductase chain 5
VGDIFFLLCISFISLVFDWESLYTKEFFLLTFFLMLAFVTKRAQVPFSSWLPAAMAAPTPVSSLVHSSTLVTAGVFLLIRFKNILTGGFFWLIRVSVMTLLLAGIIANYEWDLKKLIAYSTLRQLGLMVFTYAGGLVLLRFYHLVTHALFKASLFMSAGVAIHRADNRQEFRNSFSLYFVKPFIRAAVFICLFCLRGVPFTRGFFSKDLILDSLSSSLIYFPLFLLGVSLTIAYSLRFFFYFLVKRSLRRNTLVMVYEQTFFVVFSIWLLLIGALVVGFILFELWFSLELFL